MFNASATSSVYYIIEARHQQNTTFRMNISAELFQRWNEFDRWYIPSVIFTGIIGNIFACWVLSTTKLSRSPPSVYLATLAMSDCGHLLSYSIFWLSTVGFDLYNTIGVCQVVNFLLNYFLVLSSWVVLLFTIERFVVVHHPLSSLAKCSVSKARRNCLVLAILPILLTISVPFTTGIVPEKKRCGPLPNYSKAIMIQHIVDSTLGLFLPLVVTTVLNCKLSFELFRAQRNQLELTQPANSSSDRDGQSSSNDAQVTYQTQLVKRRWCDYCSRYNWSKEARVTWNLLFISVTFTVLSLPHAIVGLNYYVTLSYTDLRYEEFHYCLSRLAHDVLCLNFALDFWLYNFTSINFRTQACQVLEKWFRCRLGAPQSHQGSTISATNRTATIRPRSWTTSLRR